MRVVVEQKIDAGAQRVRAGLMRQVVDDLNIVFTRRVGLPDSVPNDATPAMLTAGPIGSVGGAFRSPYANLRPRLVHRPRRQRQRVAERDRLVDVVEIGRGRWRIGPAGAARVLRADVVQAVADAELIATVELMIDLAEEVRRAHRVRIDAGRDAGARITRPPPAVR